MKLKTTITAAVIAVAALAGTVAQAAPEKAPASDKAGAEAAGTMKYYQHKDAAAPGKAGAGAAPERSAPAIAPQGAPGVGAGIAPKHLDRQIWPPSYGHPGYTELLYQEEATVFGMRDRWVQRFQQHSVVIERRGDVFEAYLVKQYGWRQHTVPLFRITTDMIYAGYVYYGQPYSYRTGPYTLTVQLGDLILRGNRVQGMNFLVTLEREYSRYSNYYNGPGYPPHGGYGGYGRSAPGVTPMDAPGRAGAKAAPEKAVPGKAGASVTPDKGKTDVKDDEAAF